MRSRSTASAVKSFVEKPPGDNAYINGGFFVLSPVVIDRIEGDKTSWESTPLEALARDEQLRAYRHFGFWQPMDTLRDKMMLEELWQSGPRAVAAMGLGGMASSFRPADPAVRR